MAFPRSKAVDEAEDNLRSGSGKEMICKNHPKRLKKCKFPQGSTVKWNSMSNIPGSAENSGNWKSSKGLVPKR